MLIRIEEANTHFLSREALWQGLKDSGINSGGGGHQVNSG
jgi:hypothetical protein